MIVQKEKEGIMVDKYDKYYKDRLGDGAGLISTSIKSVKNIYEEHKNKIASFISKQRHQLSKSNFRGAVSNFHFKIFEKQLKFQTKKFGEIQIVEVLNKSQLLFKQEILPCSRELAENIASLKYLEIFLVEHFNELYRDYTGEECLGEAQYPSMKIDMDDDSDSLSDEDEDDTLSEMVHEKEQRSKKEEIEAAGNVGDSEDSEDLLSVGNMDTSNVAGLENHVQEESTVKPKSRILEEKKFDSLISQQFKSIFGYLLDKVFNITKIKSNRGPLRDQILPNYSQDFSSSSQDFCFGSDNFFKTVKEKYEECEQFTKLKITVNNKDIQDSMY